MSDTSVIVRATSAITAIPNAIDSHSTPRAPVRTLSLTSSFPSRISSRTNRFESDASWPTSSVIPVSGSMWTACAAKSHPPCFALWAQAFAEATGVPKGAESAKGAKGAELLAPSAPSAPSASSALAASASLHLHHTRQRRTHLMLGLTHADGDGATEGGLRQHAHEHSGHEPQLTEIAEPRRVVVAHADNPAGCAG